MNASILFTNQIAATVAVLPALNLLTAHLLVCWIPVKSFRTSANRLMTLGRAHRVPSANNRTRARVLTLIQPGWPADACVLLAAINICPTARLLDTESVLACVKERALTVVLTLGYTTAANTDLVVQTFS